MSDIVVHGGQTLTCEYIVSAINPTFAFNPTSRSDGNMEQFKKFVAETYPATEDFLIVWSFIGKGANKAMFMEIHRDARFVLECAQVWREMEDKDE